VKKPPLAARKLVFRPKNRGGLGVIRLRLQNEALLMKSLDKFFSKADLPWVKLLLTQYYANGKIPRRSMKGSFWWRSNLRVLDTFKGLAKADFGSGDTILFWHDLWNGHVLNLRFPQLHSFAKNDLVLVFSMLHMDNLQNHFNLLLSEEAYEQYCDLVLVLQTLPSVGENDVWSYIWENKEYSIKKAYCHLMGSNQVHPAFRWIWKSRSQTKQKVFSGYFYKTD
jgi:hypothetical protein